MRKSFTVLAAQGKAVLTQDPFGGCIFVFRDPWGDLGEGQLVRQAGSLHVHEAVSEGNDEGCRTQNARHRPGRENRLFVGPGAGGKAAIACIPDHEITKVDDLLSWRWNG